MVGLSLGRVSIYIEKWNREVDTTLLSQGVRRLQANGWKSVGMKTSASDAISTSTRPSARARSIVPINIFSISLLLSICLIISLLNWIKDTHKKSEGVEFSFSVFRGKKEEVKNREKRREKEKK